MNHLAKIFVDFQLISHNISERGLIPIEILPLTAMLKVIEGAIGLIPSRIEALIRMKTNVEFPTKLMS
jgi:hypothetical protein